MDVYGGWYVLFMMSFLRIPGLLGIHMQWVSCKFGCIQIDGVVSESKSGGDHLDRQAYVRSCGNPDRCPVGRAAQSNARFLAMSSRVCSTTLSSQPATALQRMKERFQSEGAAALKVAESVKVANRPCGKRSSAWFLFWPGSVVYQFLELPTSK